MPETACFGHRCGNYLEPRRASEGLSMLRELLSVLGICIGVLVLGGTAAAGETTHDPSAELRAAVYNNDIEMITSLLDSGVSVNDWSGEASPLHFAARGVKLDVVKLLIHTGADVDAPDGGMYGGTPLHWAIEYAGYHYLKRASVEEVVKALVEAGSSVDATDRHGLTALHWAARDGPIFVVHRLVNLGADVNARSSTGTVPLHLAAERGKTHAVDALLEAGANPNAFSDAGISPLHLAAAGAGAKQRVVGETGPLAMPGTIRSLLEYGAELDAPAQPGVATPLMIAIREDIDATLALIDAGANVNYRGGQPYSPLHLAACEKNVKAAEALLAAGADVDALDADGRTPLHWLAGASGDEHRIAKMLIAAGGDLDGGTPSGPTPMHALLPIAISAGNGRIATLLLSHGAAINDGDEAAALLALAERRELANVAVSIIERAATTEGQLLQPEKPLALLEAAARLDARLTLPRLLEHRDDRDPADDQTDAALLRTAVVHGSAAIVEFFIDRATVELRHGDRWLHLSATGGSGRVAEALLDAGVPLAEKDELGRTPLHAAVVERSSNVAELLADRGADVNAADLFGWTPFHLSLFREIGEVQHDTVRMLLERGARVDAETVLAGWRPLHIAAHLGSPEFVELLLQHGADVNARMRLGERTPLHLALRHQANLQAHATSTTDSMFWSDDELASRTAAADEVVNVLMMAGARDHDSEEAFPPVYYDGHLRDGQVWQEMLYPAPSATASSANWEVIHGSFTDAGADERLLIGAVGSVEPLGFGVAYLHGLLDQDGRMALQWLSDHRFAFVELSRDEDGVDQPAYAMSTSRSWWCGPSEATMRYEPTTRQFHSSQFESLEVELAYLDHSRLVSSGIYINFDPENLPNEKQKAQIFDTAHKAGLNQFHADTTFEDLEIWIFDYPYLRFDDDVVPVCHQFPNEIQKLWKACGSNARIAWSADC